MTKLGRIAAGVLAGLAVFLAVAITLTIGWRPFIGPRARPLTDRKFQSTPARLARGEYLVHSVTDCMGCHAEHDWTAHDAPVPPNAFGAGQDMNFVKGLPGKVYAPNITPDPETGAGNWSDDQLARGIREGVGHDGRALFPFVPFLNFRAMSDEDLASVIVYLRSIPPVRRPLPATDLIFPVKYLIRGVPQPLTAPVPEPDLSTPEKRGKYIVTISGCAGCHTPQDAHGQPLPNMDLAGGFILDGPGGQREYHPGSLGNRRVRRDHLYAGDADRIREIAEAQLDHALARVSRHDRGRQRRGPCLPEDPFTGAAPRRQHPAAHLLQGLPPDPRRRKPELTPASPRQLTRHRSRQLARFAPPGIDSHGRRIAGTFGEPHNYLEGEGTPKCSEGP
jgi:hypothetical protein